MTIGARIVAVALTTIAAGCIAPNSAFGQPCPEGGACTEGYLCVEARCVPPRQPGDVGDDCAKPLPLNRGDGKPVLAWGEAAFAGARADHNASCATDRDVVFSFSLNEPDDAPDVPDDPLAGPTGLRIRVEAPFPAALSLHRLEQDTCPTEATDGCSANPELIIANAGAGTWAVIVHGVAEQGAVVRVTVERLDCPLGYLPFGDGQCAGFHPVRPSGIKRAGAKLTTLPDGRAILTGGIEADGVAAAAGEVFEPMSETWSFIAFDERRWNHSPVVAGQDFAVLGDGRPPEVLQRDARGGDRVVPLDYWGLNTNATLFADDAPSIAVGTPSGAVLVVFDSLRYLLQIERLPIPCSVRSQCGLFPGAICVLGTDDPGMGPGGVCLCGGEPCLGSPVVTKLGDLELDGAVPLRAGTRESPLVATTRGDSEVIVLHNGGAVHLLDVASAFWRDIRLVPPRDDVALSAVAGGALATGGLENGIPSARVELVDTMAQQVRPLAPLIAPRHRHVQARLNDGRFLVAGGSSVDGVALDTAELVDLSGNAVPRLPRLPAPLAYAVAATLADGRVLVVGASPGSTLMTTALIFQTVPAGSPQSAPELSAFCGAIETITPSVPTGTIGPPWMRDTTVGELDRFREPACGNDWDTTGPERLFSFTVGGTASFMAETDLADAAFILWRGGCAEHEALGCVGAVAHETRLEAPTLTPGDYVLVVEAHAEDDDAQGTAFNLSTWLGEPYACPAGSEDPADDDAAGARRLEVMLDFEDPEYANYLDASGTLCRGDVDHLVVELWSSESELWLYNAAQNRSTLAPAIVDEAASLAAGEPVFTFGDPLPFGRGRARPGTYLLKLGIGEEDPLLHQWSVTYYPEHCVPDDVDSLVAVLDDGANAARRVVLSMGPPLLRCVTSDEDVDVTIAALPADGDAVLYVEDGYQISVQVYALAAPDAPLGAALGDPIGYGGRVVLPAGTSPWVAAVATSELTSGNFYQLRLSSTDATGACAAALPLADSGAIDYDSDSLQARLDPEELGGCTGWQAPGSELVGTLMLRSGDRIDATIEPTGQDDVSIYLLVSCATESSSCVAGLDDGIAGDSETITFTHSGPEARYYLVGDSYDVAPYSAVLSWSVTRAGQ